MANSQSALAKFFSYDTAALVLRIVLGLIFVVHGGQKIFGWPSAFTGWKWGGGWDATIAGMENFPPPLVMALMITEFVGGICIIVGLLTRFWSAGLFIAMAVAIGSVHFKQGWGPDGGFSVLRLVSANEYQAALAVMALGLFLAGPGRWALADVEGWILGVRRGGE